MALKLSLTKDGGNQPEWVRVFPQYNNNWSTDDPISLEMKVLGFNTSLAYTERIAGGMRDSRRRRTERIGNVIKDKLKACVRSGSIEGVYDEKGKPITDVESFFNHPLTPPDLLFELQDILEDLSTLQGVTEEAYNEYRQQRKKEGIGEVVSERELFDEDEVKN